MKKILCGLLAILLVLCLSACTSSQEDNKPEDNPPVNNGETNNNGENNDKDKKDDNKQDSQDESLVSIADVFNYLNAGAGKWACPCQNYDYVIRFVQRDGKYFIEMQIDDCGNISASVTPEVGSVTYNSKTNVYKFNLLNTNGIYLSDNTFSVDVNKYSDGFIEAENVFDEYKIVEYVFVAEEEMNGAPDLYYSKWQLRSQDFDPDYLPTVEFDTAGMFTFVENLYEGMGKLIGGYTITETGYECIVDHKERMEGFAGDDVTKIIFTKISETELRLETDICASNKGAIFDLIP